MMPQLGGVVHAELVERHRERLETRQQVGADDRGGRASLMFSSCPDSAFVAGVKSGSGSRSDSRRPAGSAWPQISPVAL